MKKKLCILTIIVLSKINLGVANEYKKYIHIILQKQSNYNIYYKNTIKSSFFNKINIFFYKNLKYKYKLKNLKKTTQKIILKKLYIYISYIPINNYIKLNLLKNNSIKIINLSYKNINYKIINYKYNLKYNYINKIIYYFIKQNIILKLNITFTNKNYINLLNKFIINKAKQLPYSKKKFFLNKKFITFKITHKNKFFYKIIYKTLHNVHYVIKYNIKHNYIYLYLNKISKKNFKLNTIIKININFNIYKKKDININIRKKAYIIKFKNVLNKHINFISKINIKININKIFLKKNLFIKLIINLYKTFLYKNIYNYKNYIYTHTLYNKKLYKKYIKFNKHIYIKKLEQKFFLLYIFEMYYKNNINNNLFDKITINKLCNLIKYQIYLIINNTYISNINKQLLKIKIYIFFNERKKNLNYNKNKIIYKKLNPIIITNKYQITKKLCIKSLINYDFLKKNFITKNISLHYKNFFYTKYENICFKKYINKKVHITSYININKNLQIFNEISYNLNKKKMTKNILGIKFYITKLKILNIIKYNFNKFNGRINVSINYNIN
ncbi:MAG: hypothetical protein HYZ30_01600 [Candidatus Azosocius agrarius]|nr:MAG: hypothetical protein HYZ30_01600 [Gammaproteobacteria bacterium]